MGTIKDITWPIEPHTEAKHEILRKYLDAWLPILGSWHRRIVYIDGFAGPGEYKGGENGSPIIAIKAVKEHKSRIDSEVVMFFIEADKKRCNHLENKLKTIEIPKNISYQCICKNFDEMINELFDYLEEKKKRIAPTFVFIDPFGFSGIPMQVIKRIMENKKCEVFITFMYEHINRFIKDKGIWNCLIDTFGTEEWKGVVPIKDPKERENVLYSIYEKQLKKVAEIEYVRGYKMISKFNKLYYILIFGTNHIEGLKAMKRAMYKVGDPMSFQFSDYSYSPGQQFLFTTEPDYNILKEDILKRFAGKTVLFKDLENYVLIETPFISFKRAVLEPLEKEKPPKIKVLSDENRKRYSYKDYYRVKFL